MKSILILGIGNDILTDNGIGPKMFKKLEVTDLWKDDVPI